jgi:hypothetical protein
MRRRQVPFRVVEADPPTPLLTIAAHVWTGLRLACRWLATPPGTPIRSTPSSTAPAAAAATVPGAAADGRSVSVWHGCTCAACQPQPGHTACTISRDRHQQGTWQPGEDAAAPERPVLIDGLPVDPLAFDADPDAFLRAVFGRTYEEPR